MFDIISLLTKSDDETMQNAFKKHLSVLGRSKIITVSKKTRIVCRLFPLKVKL